MNSKLDFNQSHDINAEHLPVGKTPVKSRRWSSFLPVLLVVTLILILSGCAAIRSTQGISSLNPTNTVPKMTASSTETTGSLDSTERDFTLTDVEGMSLTLSQTYGQKVYIKFWATWCPICLSGLEDLEQYSKDKRNDAAVVVLTIVSPGAKGEMSRENFINWYEKQGYTFPVLLDDGGVIARLYEVRGYPTSVFIDTSGKIVRSQPGHIASEEIDHLFDSIM